MSMTKLFLVIKVGYWKKEGPLGKMSRWERLDLEDYNTLGCQKVTIYDGNIYTRRDAQLSDMILWLNFWWMVISGNKVLWKLQRVFTKSPRELVGKMKKGCQSLSQLVCKYFPNESLQGKTNAYFLNNHSQYIQIYICLREKKQILENQIYCSSVEITVKKH